MLKNPTELKNKIPDVSLATKAASTAVENKIPDVSCLVPKNIYIWHKNYWNWKETYWSWSWKIWYCSRI